MGEYWGMGGAERRGGEGKWGGERGGGVGRVS